MSFTISLPGKQPLHTGKWTHEESEYVQELIKEFEAGALNIEENISLRRFLSQALNCSPKRISKFEGTLYNGKQLYKRKISEMAPEHVAARRAKLHALEKKYQESLRVLELVENSRRPSSSSGTTGKAIKTEAFLARTAAAAEIAPKPASVPQLQLPASVSSFNSGFPASQSDISRAARIAKLKADIAIASMTLESAQAFPTGPAASLQECLIQGRNHALASSTDATGTSNDPVMAHLREQLAQREILASFSLPSSSSSEGSSSPWISSSLAVMAQQRQLEWRQHQLQSFMDSQTSTLLSAEYGTRLGRGSDDQLQLKSLLGKHANSAAAGNKGGNPPMKRFRLS